MSRKKGWTPALRYPAPLLLIAQSANGVQVADSFTTVNVVQQDGLLLASRDSYLSTHISRRLLQHVIT